MYTLYWEFMAGSILPHAMLSEVGADFQLNYIDMGAGKHRSPEFLGINPAGRVPALTLPDGTTIGETAAIATVLGEQFPDSGITPLPGSPQRPAFLFWLSVMATAGYPGFSREAHPEQFAVTDDAQRQVSQKATVDLGQFFDRIERNISGDPFFLTCGFTALDIYLAMLVEWVTDRAALFSSRPRLEALVSAVTVRPAYRKAIETHNLH